MRTTLTLEEDVAQSAKRAATESGKPFKQVINDALRLGLQQLHSPGRAKRYRTKPRKLGLKPGVNLDDIGALLAQAEGDDYR
jgi:hypothetical protein